MGRFGEFSTGQKEFFAGDVERITGVQRLRLHHWMKEGFLIPSGQVAKGHGTKNIYTREDLYQIALLKKLIENGMHGWVAKNIASIDVSLLLLAHYDMKSQNRPGVKLCVMRLLADDKESELAILNNLGDLYPGKNAPPLSLEISRLFDELKFDDAYIVNLEKIIDDVDSRI